MPITTQRGFVGFPILIAIVLGLIGIGGGAYYLIHQNTGTRSSLVSPPQSAPCVDFKSFESMAFIGLRQSAPVLDLQPVVSSSLEGYFDWKRSAGEPFITYPYLQYSALVTPWAVGSTQPGLPSEPDNAAFKTGAVSVSTVLQNNVTHAAQTLGFSVTALNTLPYHVQNPSSDPTYWDSIYQRFGFTKNGSLYDAELTAQPGGQSTGYVQISVACAVPDPTSDHVYNLLLSQIPQSQLPIETALPSMNNELHILEVAKDLSAVNVGDVDGKVYSLMNDRAVLVSAAGSSIPKCQALERHHVGLGLSCIDSQTGAERTVSYDTTEPSFMTFADSAFGYRLQYPAGYYLAIQADAQVSGSPDIEIARDDGLSPYPDDYFQVWIFNQGDPRIPTDVSNSSVHTQAEQWMHASVKMVSGTPYDRYWINHDGRVYMIQFTSADAAFKTMLDSFTFAS